MDHLAVEVEEEVGQSRNLVGEEEAEVVEVVEA